MPEPRVPVSPGEVDLLALWVSGMSIIEYLELTEALSPGCATRAHAGDDAGLTDDELDLIHAVKVRCDREQMSYIVW